ncbi:acyltransferase family protein [Roseomonas harenae]|uniref:acyltransferase family protein n=1 Tax=Muricoccus harenae TaxID=2692566 RepID=UPI001331B35C|nr:acyltransferase [Roseomonas harenae]
MHEKENFIQWLRALAAMEVVIWHSDLVAKHFSPMKIQGSPYDYLGGFGVELFFIISGYVICLSAPRYATGTSFILARFARLAPVYWFFTAMVFLASWINPQWSQGSLDSSGTAIAKSLLFLPQLEMPILAPGWSLEHEMIFYAVVALWLMAFGTLRAAGQTGVAIVLLAFGCAGFFLGTGLARRLWDYHVLSPYMLAFAIGWLFCLAHAAVGRSKMLLYVAPFAIMLLLAIAPIELGERPLLHRIALAAALFVFACSMRSLLEAATPLNRMMARVGDASYSIYLSHWFGLSVIGKLLGFIGPAGGFDALARLLAALVCVAVGLVIFERFEGPVDRFLKGVIRPKREPASKRAADTIPANAAHVIIRGPRPAGPPHGLIGRDYSS